MLPNYPYGKYAGLGTQSGNVPVDSGVMTTNEKLSALTEEKESLQEELLEVNAEIEYQEKLKALELSGDPMWELAKENYVRTGDMTALQNIMNRHSTEKMQQLTAQATADARKETKEEQRVADVRSARTNRDILTELLKTYNSVKGDPTKQIEAGNELVRQLQKTKEAADKAGMTVQDLYSEMPEELEAINVAITEARGTAKTRIEKDQEKNAKNKAHAKLLAAVKNEVDMFNTGKPDIVQLTSKKKDLAKAYPGFIFSVKNQQIEFKEKAK
jgi:hypothetical protein